jgi:hypothetical protein
VVGQVSAVLTERGPLSEASWSPRWPLVGWCWVPIPARSWTRYWISATVCTTVLDHYKPYLHQRWTKGGVSVPQLVAEIRGQGYRGSARTVYRYLRPSQAQRNPPPPASAPPTIRAVTGWIMSNPDTLDNQDHHRLQVFLTRCPELEATRRHVDSFAHMIRDLAETCSQNGSTMSVPTTCPPCTPSPRDCNTTTQP